MNGCFINLQRSSARREAMQAQLQALGLHGVTRLAAVDAADLHGAQAPHTVHGSRISAGEHACFLSHLAALEQGLPGSFHLVLEDDALLSPALPQLLRQAEALARLEAFDLVFLECMPYTSAPALLPLWRSLRQHLPPAAAGAPREALAGIEILEAKGLYNWGAVAYLATPRGLRSLPGLLRQALAAGPAQALDLTLSTLIEQGRLRAAVLAPFLATPRQGELGHSTITDRDRASENEVLGHALRRLFFAGPVDGLEAEVAPYRHAPLTDDPQLRLLADLMAQLFVITARQAKEGAPRD